MLNHHVPAFPVFAKSVSRGSSESIRGIYIEKILALPVIQQPAYDPAYVSSQGGVATLFSLAAKHGVTGLLAHNYLAGSLFYQVKLGSEARVVYGEQRFRSFRVTQRLWYQKLSPYDRQSDYLDLSSGSLLTTRELFDRFYKGNHLTLQTCLERESISTWGLMFLVAQPLQQVSDISGKSLYSAWL